MKKTYIQPTIKTLEIISEGMIAGSDRVPVDPNPGDPATNKKDRSWGKDIWTEN